MKQRIAKKKMERYLSFLTESEHARATVEKYRRDLVRFLLFCGERPVDRTVILEYKEFLKGEYATASANSMIAAVNGFVDFMGRPDWRIRPFKVQKKVYSPEERELTKAEYLRLLQVSGERLSLILQTICGTGIRVSELRFITVDAARRGEAEVSCKGKHRTVFLVRALRKKLLQYARKAGIESGSVFVTKSGKPLNRSNIWKEMKRLCEKAEVSPGKVFPHNLRHLFARTFYEMEKDLAKLADILGHSDINTTRIYLITTMDEHRRRIERMRLIL